MRCASLLGRRLGSIARTSTALRHRTQLSHVRPFCAAGQKPATSPKDADATSQKAGLTKTDNPEANEDDEQKPGVVGGFVRGLLGGHEVAQEDAYVAHAKEQGIELPPPRPERTELVALKRRKRREEDEDEGEGGGIRDRLFSRFKGSAFMRGATEASERIKERIDESENPLVNMFRNMFAENEMGAVIREIREDDPTFRVSEFIDEIEHKLVPTIIGRYLHADRDGLRKHVTDEAFEMLNASIREREATGVVMDTEILAVDNVELYAAKLLEDAPVLIVSFSLQQINCVRNAVGDIIEGAEDDIRAVYYMMAFVREVEYEDDMPTGGGVGSDEGTEKSGDAEANGEDEKEKKSESDTSQGPAPWKMMEMVIRGAHSTI